MIRALLTAAKLLKRRGLQITTVAALRNFTKLSKVAARDRCRPLRAKVVRLRSVAAGVDTLGFTPENSKTTRWLVEHRGEEKGAFQCASCFHRNITGSGSLYLRWPSRDWL